MDYIGNVFRPPSEARSFILQVTLGCSHNACTYCSMYLDKPFQLRSWEDIKQDIDEASAYYPDCRRVFLADGDAFSLSSKRLKTILQYLNEKFPLLRRVGIYIYAKKFTNKSVADLQELRDLKLSIAYMGLESGCNEVLKNINKGCTAEEMIDAVQLLKQAGIKSSVIGMLGIGGTALSQQHCQATAKAMNKMQAEYFSLLTTTVVPGSQLAKEVQAGKFTLPNPLDMVKEIRWILQDLKLDRTIFRSNHASNYLALSGTLNKDKDSLINQIDLALAGKTPLYPEYLRGL